jgi:hypothetical protein
LKSLQFWLVLAGLLLLLGVTIALLWKPHFT